MAKKDGTYVPRPKRTREEMEKSTSSTPSAAPVPPAPKAPKLMVNNVPHRILFAQNLPDDCTDAMLTMFFQAYPGFQEVRMVPGKKGLAFIDFQDVIQAGIALKQLNGFKLNANDTLNLTYAKQ